jgi:hypothetical protein
VPPPPPKKLWTLCCSSSSPPQLYFVYFPTLLTLASSPKLHLFATFVYLGIFEYSAYFYLFAKLLISHLNTSPVFDFTRIVDIIYSLHLQSPMTSLLIHLSRGMSWTHVRRSMFEIQILEFLCIKCRNRMQSVTIAPETNQ